VTFLHYKNAFHCSRVSLNSLGLGVKIFIMWRYPLLIPDSVITSCFKSKIKYRSDANKMILLFGGRLIDFIKTLWILSLDIYKEKGKSYE
jgi:hypothetical protein